MPRGKKPTAVQRQNWKLRRLLVDAQGQGWISMKIIPIEVEVQWNGKSLNVRLSKRSQNGKRQNTSRPRRVISVSRIIKELSFAFIATGRAICKNGAKLAKETSKISNLHGWARRPGLEVQEYLLVGSEDHRQVLKSSTFVLRRQLQ